MVESAQNGLLRVNFSLRGFAKTIDRTKLTQCTPEPVALEAFGRFLASLSLTPDDPVLFTSLPEFRGIDYVGYIIEKERLDPTDGTWLRLEEYRIMGSQACSYKDTRVAYGYTYRYRIRTVVKFTAANPDMIQAAKAAQDLSTVMQNSLLQTVTDNGTLLSRLVPSGLQSVANANISPTVTLTDNLSISVDSNGVPQFNYSISSPEVQALNSQAVNSLQSLQLALASNKPISNSDLQTHINALANYSSTPITSQTYLSEYLVSYPSRNWKYAVIKNDQLPAWPESINVVPCTPKNTITVYWLSPPDPQMDLASFNVYRRNAVGDSWALVANVPVGVNFYQDTDVTPGMTYIYAVQSYSLHGYQGFLSTQVQAQLNSSFNFEQKEKDLVWISGPGVRPDEPDTIFAAFYDTAEQLIAYNNIRISPSKTFTDDSATVVVKVRSLDTQEKKEFVVNLKNKPNT